METGISGTRAPSGGRHRRLLRFLVVAAVAGGSHSAVQAADQPGAGVAPVDPSSWSPLPEGLLPGAGRILIERDGSFLRAAFPGSFDVADRQEARVRVGGDLNFTLMGRGSGGRGATLTILRLGTPGDRVAVNVIVEVRLRGRESALPARFRPARDDRIALLGIAGGGDDVARGLHDATRDEGLDCGRIDPRFTFRLLPASPLPVRTGGGRASGERTVRVSGSVPQGRELVLFDWTLKSRVLGASRERAASSVSYHGWRLRGFSGPRLRRAVEELEAETLLGGASYVEIGDGWQSRRSRSGQRPFERLERNWFANLPLDPASAVPVETPVDSSRDGAVPGTASREETVFSEKAVSSESAASSRTRRASVRRDDPDGQKGAQSVEPAVRSLIDRGMQPGLWIVPLGQTEDTVFDERPDAFVRDGKGRSLAGNYLGKYVVDPTGAAGEAYLRDLFRRLRATGARVFRIAGLDRAVDYYGVHRRALEDGSRSPIEIVKRSLAVMREGAGAGATLAGAYGTPRELAAALDAVRPGVAGERSLTDLQREGLATSTWLALHRRLLDVESLPLAPRFFVNDRDDLGAMLRSYLLFAALTGRGVVLDGTWEAPGAVRPLFQHVRAPTEVYPLDLFPRQTAPPIWVVKPSGADLDRSVVGLFNWSDLTPTRLVVPPTELGLRPADAAGTLLWFDLVSERFVGSGWLDHDFFLLPGHSRFLELSVLGGTPRVVAVSGHVLGRELFLRDLRWDPEGHHLSGRLRLDARAGGDPADVRVESAAKDPESNLESDLETGAEKRPETGESSRKEDARETARRVHIAVPSSVRPVRIEVDAGTAGFEVSGGHVVATIDSPDDLEGGVSGPLTVSFRLTFERVTETAPSRPAGIDGLDVSYQSSARRPLLSWRLEDGGHAAWRDGAGFEVLRDGGVIGTTTDTRFLDDEVAWGGSHEYAVRPVRESPPDDAQRGVDAVRRTFDFPAPEDTKLVNLYPRDPDESGAAPSRLRSVLGGPLRVGGRRVREGWGVRPPSRIDFRIDGSFAEFRAGLGVDDASLLQGSVVFVVEVDGREAYRGPRVVGDGAVPREIRVDTRAGKVLSLIVEDGRDGAEWDYADWCEPRMIVSPGEQ